MLLALSLFPTFLRISAASGESLQVLRTHLDNPGLSTADYDVEQANDYMQKLAILLTVGAWHSTITVTPDWYEHEDMSKNPTGLPGNNGVPVRIYNNGDGSYNLACSLDYPYKVEFDAGQKGYWPTGDANAYYYMTGLVSNDALLYSQNEAVKGILEKLRPNSSGWGAVGSTASKFVVGKVVGKIISVVFGVAFNKVYGVAKATMDGLTGWQKAIKTNDTITNTQNFMDFNYRVSLLGGTLSYVVKPNGEYKVIYLGFNSPEAFFRIQGYLEIYGGTQEGLIYAILAGKQPEFGQFQSYINADKHKTFANSLRDYHTWLRIKKRNVARAKFEEYSTNELMQLYQEMKKDTDYSIEMEELENDET